MIKINKKGNINQLGNEYRNVIILLIGAKGVGKINQPIHSATDILLSGPHW